MGNDFTEQMKSRVEMLRQDLQVEMERINPQPGEIVVVRPKSDDIVFSDNYRNWVVSVLHHLRPDVQIMVLTDNNINIAVEKQS